MSSEDEALEEEKSQRDRILWRTIIFLVINGPTTVFTLGMWVRIGGRMSAHGGHGGGDWMMKATFIVWIVGIAGSALAIFKK